MKKIIRNKLHKKLESTWAITWEASIGDTSIYPLLASIEKALSELEKIQLDS